MILRHPSQLYEAVLEGLILFLLLFLFLNKKNLRKFNASCVFLIFYGLSRIFIEFFREPDSHIGYLYMNLSTGQILSIPMILTGFILLKTKNVKKKIT
jgi:phosphatidylglycerol:prolipoprotein diacylglycerol transferase